MVQDDPKKRPTMDEVVARFEIIQKTFSSWKLRSRVVPRKETSLQVVPHRVGHWIRRIGFIIKRVHPIPQTGT